MSEMIFLPPGILLQEMMLGPEGENGLFLGCTSVAFHLPLNASFWEMALPHAGRPVPRLSIK